MTVTRNQFVSFLHAWVRNQDPDVRAAVPTKTYNAIYEQCTQAGDGLSLSVVRVAPLLSGEESQRLKAAAALTAAVMERWGGAQGQPVQAAASSAQPIGQLRDPGHRIGAASGARPPASDQLGEQDAAPAPPQPSAAAESSPLPRAAGPTPSPAASTDAHPGPSGQADGVAGVTAESDLPPAAAPEPQWIFPEYDFSRDDLDSPEDPVAVQVQRTEDGRLFYSWPDPGDGEVFRVVVSDEAEIEDPGEGIELVATTQPACEDTLSHPFAVHFVSVWAYQVLPGLEVLGQCRRIASAVDVHPLAGWEVDFDEESRAVIGRWDQVALPAGAGHEVVTARLPVGQSAARHMKGSIWRSYAIENNGAGFQDLDVTGGQRYTYLAALDVTLGGRTFTSKPSRLDVQVPRLVLPVTDLSVQSVEHEDGTQSLTMTWTETEGAQVSIYVTSEPPNPGAVARGRIPASQLAAAGLRQEDRVRNPAGIERLPDQPGRQRRHLQAVAWKEGTQWDSIAVTAVVEEGDEVALGEPQRLKRVMPPRFATVDRYALSHDRITFSWPGEASSVLVSADPEGRRVGGQVDRETYEKDGGMLIPFGMLPAEGATAYLSSVQYLAGQEQRSTSTTLEVPPLWVYRYAIDWPSAARRHLPGTKFARLRIEATRPVPATMPGPHVVLVSHPQHLPLSATDGDCLTMALVEPTRGMAAEEMQLTQMLQLGAQSGEVWVEVSQCEGRFVRLMVCEPSRHSEAAVGGAVLEEHALLDPPVEQLVYSTRPLGGRR